MMKRQRPDGLYTAFDLGSFAVKAVVVERLQGRDRLTLIEEESLRPASEFATEADYRDHQVQAIRSLSARLPMKESEHIAALFNSREMQVKIAELPAQIQHDQIEGVLWFEARKLLSPNFRQDPFIMGYRLLRDSPPTALVTCIPQALLTRFTDLFDAAGVTLTGVYGEVFATYALRETQDLGAVPTLAFANVGHASTYLTIFAAGELKFYRHIPAGTSEIPEMAESQDLDVYFQKIRFSFDYFKAVSKLGQIDEIRFIGGGPGRGEFLSHAREYFAPTRTGPLDVSARLDVAAVLSPGTAALGPNEAAVRLLPSVPAIGTLLAHLDPNCGTGDLLGRLQERRREALLGQLTTQIPLYLGSIGIVLLLLLLLSLRSGASAELEGARQKGAIERATLDGLRLKLAGARSAAGAVSNDLPPRDRKALAPLLKPHRTPAEVLYLTAQARPEGLTLSRIAVISRQTDASAGLEERLDQAPAAEPGTTGPAPGEAAPSLPSIDAAQPAPEAEQNEELRGEILELRGLSRSPEALAAFTAALVRKGALRRVTAVRCRFSGASPDGAAFVVKGELP